jgi:hypothetical protein
MVELPMLVEGLEPGAFSFQLAKAFMNLGAFRKRGSELASTQGHFFEKRLHHAGKCLVTIRWP